MKKHDEKKQGIAECVSNKKRVNEKEYKIREKTKENKASPKAHTLLYRGQTCAEETCSKTKQNQSAIAKMAWE